MHRTTPNASAFRAYVSGGARSVVHSVDDTSLMQNMKGNFMAGESRDKIEAPQNYGFTSVTMDGDGMQDSAGGGGGGAGGPVGSIGQQSGMGPETFITYPGGNRSFPVTGPIDDRRHRLINLDKGDSAMFSTQGRKQQVQMATDGVYHSTPNNQTWRTALLDESSEQDQTQQTMQQQRLRQMPGGPSHVAALAAVAAGEIAHIGQLLTRPIPGVPTLYDTGGTGSATSGTNAAGSYGGMQRGQKSLKDKNKQASMFFEITKDATKASGKIVQLIKASGGGGGGGSSIRAASGSSGSSSSSGTVLAEASSDSKMYVGGSKGKGKYSLVVTVNGPTINVQGRIG